MIIGSGLIATAFKAYDASGPTKLCVYAAGVSNSGCTDAREFEREKARLRAALRASPLTERFLYFSTCSVFDPIARASPYVTHKIAMERLVADRPNHLVLRLSQVAGRTPNPHTLLNYLYARMIRSERFQIWGQATRNIIDIDDVVALTRSLIEDEDAHDELVNVANPRSVPMSTIVRDMAEILGVEAVFDVVPKGAEVAIDTGRIRDAIDRCAVSFDESYCRNVIEKYYGEHSRR